jgi:hypothetical protein
VVTGFVIKRYDTPELTALITEMKSKFFLSFVAPSSPYVKSSTTENVFTVI